MEDYLILQICRVKLQEALDSGRKEKMIESLKYSSGILPFSVALNGVEETRVIIYSNHGRPMRVPFDYLDELSAMWNVQGFIAAIDKEFAYGFQFLWGRKNTIQLGAVWCLCMCCFFSRRAGLGSSLVLRVLSVCLLPLGGLLCRLRRTICREY